jgi:hypothetical protein
MHQIAISITEMTRMDVSSRIPSRHDTSPVLSTCALNVLALNSYFAPSVAVPSFFIAPIHEVWYSISFLWSKIVLADHTASKVECEEKGDTNESDFEYSVSDFIASLSWSRTVKIESPSYTLLLVPKSSQSVYRISADYYDLQDNNASVHVKCCNQTQSRVSKTLF